MTKFELIKVNKARYERLLNEISKMDDGFEKDVKKHLILAWIKGDNWMGGLSDGKFDKIVEKMPYDPIDILDEFHRQVMEYVARDTVKNSC